MTDFMNRKFKPYQIVKLKGFDRPAELISYPIPANSKIAGGPAEETIMVRRIVSDRTSMVEIEVSEIERVLYPNVEAQTAAFVADSYEQ